MPWKNSHYKGKASVLHAGYGDRKIKEKKLKRTFQKIIFLCIWVL